jgi:hypothetical protein
VPFGTVLFVFCYVLVAVYFYSNPWFLFFQTCAQPPPLEPRKDGQFLEVASNLEGAYSNFSWAWFIC